jgi:CrcB protein
MRELLWICAGGAAGSGARYLVSIGMLRWLGDRFPHGTLVVNLLGSFLLAALMHVGLKSELMSPTLRLALTTGVLGGFTTFSTFSYETLRLAQSGAQGLALLNVAITVLACLAAAYLGFEAARWWLER